MRAREKLLVLLIAAILIITGFEIFSREAALPGSVEPPQQTILEDRREIVYEGKNGPVTLVFLAEYDISAVVKSRKNYTDDTAAAVSPMDLVLAWGDLNKQEINKEIIYSQSGRWYFYRVRENAAVDLYDVQTQSSNTHIIPADAYVLSQLKRIRKNDIIELNGYLVSVIFYPGQDPWTSSLTREDSGDHSCEILYVTSVVMK